MISRFLVLFNLILIAASLSAQTVIVDNASPGFTIEAGSWQTGTATGQKYGPDYRFASSSSTGVTARARFTPDLPLEGYYYVSVWYNVGANRAIDAPYTIHAADETRTVRVNQQVNGGQWYYIGQAFFEAGTGGSVSLANNAEPSVVMADAVQFDYAGAQPGPEPPLAYPLPSGPATPEIRGLWVSRFEWPGSSESQTKARIDQIINAMAQGNFNALYMQVRGAMETHYPSANEPWARAGFNYQPQSYDPMAYGITKSHQNGIEFHAYINTHVIYQGTAMPSVPGNQPIHPIFLHGNPSDPNARDWLFYVAPNDPLQFGEGEENYMWIAPGVPDVQKWVREQIVYIAKRYNVDGVHFDRIRFPGNGSYDPVSLTRSAVGHPGNPRNLTSFRNWNRDQITRFLNDVYGAIAEINYTRPPDKRRIVVSTAPFRGKSQQESVNQMLGDWNAIGGQDYFAPQIYTTDMSHFNSTLATNFPLAHGRGVVAGLSRNVSGQTISRIANQIQNARNAGALGNIIFSYTGFASGDFNSLRSMVYQQKAPIPDMPWLTNPTDAIIVGNVTGPNNEPLVDVQLTRSGSNYIWLSSQDGFYSMLRTPANQNLTITTNASLYGYPSRTITVPALEPGEVRRINIQLGVSDVADWALY